MPRRILKSHAPRHEILGDDEVSHDNLVAYVIAEHLSLPNTLANVLSDHNLANHPLSILPTLDLAHIPTGIQGKLTGACGFATAPYTHPAGIQCTLIAADIPNLDVAKITSGRFGMSRIPDGTDTYILTAKGAGINPVYEAPPAPPSATKEILLKVRIYKG